MKKVNTSGMNAIFYWLLTICYMVLIYYLSSIRGNRFSGLLNDYDKPLHLLIYTILAFLIYRSFDKTGIKRYLLILSFLFTVIYGITDEVHQLHVPLRDTSIGDVIADSLGALLGSYSASRFT